MITTYYVRIYYYRVLLLIVLSSVCRGTYLLSSHVVPSAHRPCVVKQNPSFVVGVCAHRRVSALRGQRQQQQQRSLRPRRRSAIRCRHTTATAMCIRMRHSCPAYHRAPQLPKIVHIYLTSKSSRSKIVIIISCRFIVIIMGYQVSLCHQEDMKTPALGKT